MRKINLLLLISILFIQVLSAQTEEKKLAVGLSAGLNEYFGDRGNGFLKFNNGIYPLGALSLQTFVSNSFDLGVQGSFGRYGLYNSATDFFLGNKYDAFMYLNYKLNNGYILPVSSKLSPFLTAGIGLSGYLNPTVNSTTIETFPMDLVVPVGAGLKYQLTENIALQYKYQYFFTNHDNHDMKLDDLATRAIGKSVNDRFGEHLLGVVFSLGCKSDKDKDGVEDKYDKCPGTSSGVKVDANGCPLDTDKDGVADYLDKCPNTVANAKVDANGCPLDTDKDGVADYLDKCPKTPAGVKVDASGCPVDTDKDGVADYLDKCANTASGVKVDTNGCPVDTDKDGVADYLDKCPTIAGKAEFKGCPDTDGDGIADNEDKCPTVAGVASNKGCPEVKAEVKKVFSQALTGVQFETGKDVIKKTSYPILNNVVKIMKDNPEYLLGINGHTDNVGDDAKNMTLSQNRANAVQKYLVDKGIAADRLTAKGWGETQPIADNNTAAGRAKNRRVEFKVDF